MEPTYQTIVTFVTSTNGYELRIYSFNMMILVDLDKGTKEELNYQRFINYSLDKAIVLLTPWSIKAIAAISVSTDRTPVRDNWKLLKALTSYYDAQEYLSSAY